MAKTELKALTFIHLPFIEEDYEPGKMIPRDRFDAYAEQAAAAIDSRKTEVPTADEVIAEFIEYGSLSEDPDAEVHPDHRPVDPGAPSVAAMIESARAIVELLGDDTPEEVRALAKLDYEHVATGEAPRRGTDRAAKTGGAK
jgi:hypothetical protein